LGGGDACPVHDTAQNPFQGVMAQRGMCSEGRAPHSVVSLGGAKGGATLSQPDIYAHTHMPDT
jgi:hypothetical protein